MRFTHIHAMHIEIDRFAARVFSVLPENHFFLLSFHFFLPSINFQSPECRFGRQWWLDTVASQFSELWASIAIYKPWSVTQWSVPRMDRQQKFRLNKNLFLIVVVRYWKLYKEERQQRKKKLDECVYWYGAMVRCKIDLIKTLARPRFTLLLFFFFFFSLSLSFLSLWGLLLFCMLARIRNSFVNILHEILLLRFEACAMGLHTHFTAATHTHGAVFEQRFERIFNFFLNLI